MGDLLDFVVAAHGGMDRWQRVRKVTGRSASSGALWAAKGWPKDEVEAQYTVETDQQRTVFSPFIKSGQSGIYEPDRTAIVADNGEVIEELKSPKASFRGHTWESRWSALQLLYFRGYAQWIYMNLPFLLKRPDFDTRELETWSEDGETWRRLEVTFPDSVSAHAKIQTFYFDCAGLLRRNDYVADVAGRGALAAHYTSDHKSFDGIASPTKRRVYSVGPDKLPMRDRLNVGLDYSHIQLS